MQATDCLSRQRQAEAKRGWCTGKCAVHIEASAARRRLYFGESRHSRLDLPLPRQLWSVARDYTSRASSTPSMPAPALQRQRATDVYPIAVTLMASFLAKLLRQLVLCIARKHAASLMQYWPCTVAILPWPRGVSITRHIPSSFVIVGLLRQELHSKQQWCRQLGRACEHISRSAASEGRENTAPAVKAGILAQRTGIRGDMRDVRC